MSSTKTSSASKDSQLVQYCNVNDQLLSSKDEFFNQICKPSQLLYKAQLLKSKADETQLQPLQGFHSRKKYIKINKKIAKQKIFSQEMKPWFDEQPTIPFPFDDQLSSISYRNQQNTPQDSLINFFRKSQLQNQQQFERFSEISSYPSIPKYQFQQKSQCDKSSQMDQEDSSLQIELKEQQTPSNQIQYQIQKSQKQKFTEKQNNIKDQIGRYSTQKLQQIMDPVYFVLPKPNRYIHNFYKNKQLIVLPQYESKIQDNSLLAVKGIQVRVKLRGEQMTNYPQFLPQLQKSQNEDNLKRSLRNKWDHLKNEQNQKLQQKQSQSNKEADQKQNYK